MSSNDTTAADVLHGQPARINILQSAAILFAKNGYTASTVKAICAHADVTMDTFSQYFSGKQNLRDSLLHDFSVAVFETPMRLLQHTPKSKRKFSEIMSVLFEEMLFAITSQRHTFTFIMREQITAPTYSAYNAALMDFLLRSQQAGYIRRPIDPEMISGHIFNRLGSQVMNAAWDYSLTGADIINDAAYRKRWTYANLDLFLHGLTS